MHMQDPVQFEQDIFKDAFNKKLDEFIVECKRDFVEKTNHVCDEIIEILEKYSELLEDHNDHNEALTSEQKKSILRHVYSLVFD